MLFGVLNVELNIFENKEDLDLLVGFKEIFHEVDHVAGVHLILARFHAKTLGELRDECRFGLAENGI